MSFLDGKKTFIGIIVAAAPTILGFFGITLGVGDALEGGALLTTLTENLEAIIVSGGAIFAWYGRSVTKA